MSPEQLRGKELDARTDLFSFGVVLYEMATGKSPFRGSTIGELSNSILAQKPTPPVRLNPEIPVKLEEIINKALEKDRDLRYQNAGEIRADLLRLKREIESGQMPASAILPHISDQRLSQGRVQKVWTLVGVVVLIALLVGVGLFFYPGRARSLTEKDTIVLAPFENKTGEAVFDESLGQGLAVTLGQSPFLKLLPEQKLNAVLKLVGHREGEPLTRDTFRDVCIRTNSKAMLQGSISELGRDYVIALNVSRCDSGEVLAREQVQIKHKEEVLHALDGAVSKLRNQLGESLSTIHRYDAPLEQVTTASLDALQAYSAARKTDARHSIPLYKRAIELDPQFAMAYSGLGVAHSNLGEERLAIEYASKAYDLRSRVSERERYRISAFYYEVVTGELEKAIETYQQWAQAYPLDDTPPGNMGLAYARLGQYENAVQMTQESVRLGPDDVTGYLNLMLYLVATDRFAEAKATYDEAMRRKLEEGGIRGLRLLVALLEDDQTEVDRQLAWAKAHPTETGLLSEVQANQEAYLGHMDRARAIVQEEVGRSKYDQSEAAAQLLLSAALRDVEVGSKKESRQQLSAALKRASSPYVDMVAALALARTGQTQLAERMITSLNRSRPKHTLYNGYWRPTIQAAIELQRGYTDEALAALTAASAYESADPSIGRGNYPMYVRGEALLRAGKGDLAAAEFQKVINRPTGGKSVLNALAHLHLGRAKAMAGDKDGARQAYERFFTLWKDADPDVPILRAAKAEYARFASSSR
jgi:eukaryotic-like serine/threonine-protein kinase